VLVVVLEANPEPESVMRRPLLSNLLLAPDDELLKRSWWGEEAIENPLRTRDDSSAFLPDISVLNCAGSSVLKMGLELSSWDASWLNCCWSSSKTWILGFE